MIRKLSLGGYFVCILLFYMLSPLSAAPVHSASVQSSKPKEISLDEVINLIILKYPSINIARLEVEQARQEFAKIESQLGWVLSAQSGISRDISAFNVPSQSFDANVRLARTHQSGSSLELTGDYSYVDSERVVIVANPSKRTRLDVSYRIPLSQGDGNPRYTQGIALAKAGYDLSLAEKITNIDALINESTNLFYNAATTVTRINDANSAIKRALRLLRFVKKNKALGLSERKDLLDVRALYLSKIAERDNLLVIWSRQRSELNRLMGRKASSEFIPHIELRQSTLVREHLLETMYLKSPSLLFQQAQLKQAESEITLANDAKKEQLDLILSVGARNTSGSSGAGSASENEWAGGARLEYSFSFDKRGFNAELYQQILTKQVVEEEIVRLKTEIDYALDSLLDQIIKSKKSIKSIKRRLSVEKQKVSEVFDRYKIGRSNTNELIDNENELFVSSLLYKTRKIELSRMYSELDLMLGVLWDSKTLLSRTGASE